MDIEHLKELIADHSKHPRNKQVLETWTHTCEGKNPLCGDEICIRLQIEQAQIVTAAFQGRGCGISQASASILTETVQGLSITDCLQIYETLHAKILNQTPPNLPPPLHEVWEELEPLVEIRLNPMRVKCVTLAWHTLHHALIGLDTASSEH
ncbi:MAG: SUF system NifU family Fe-S cluster assembly protein [Gammaproteobacteria bacterium]|nr:SUF system NifU family Fe-S cluster assembly protein [Gammaproteobacteria bacterium]